MANYLDSDGLLYLWQKLKTQFSTKVDKVSGKGLSTNDYTTAEKTKLSGIAAGAEVNQNAFTSIAVGSTTIAADSKTDTLTFAAGSNVTLTPNAANDTLTIAAANTTYSAATTSANGLMTAADKAKLDGIAANANKYTLPTASTSTLGGVKTTSTVTSTTGLTASPIINGVPYYKDTNTTYGLATASANGLLAAADYTRLHKTVTGENLAGDGAITVTPTYDADNETELTGVVIGAAAATTSAAGTMSAADKTKLDGIAAGANRYVHPSYTTRSAGMYKVTVDAAGHVSAATAVTKADITALGIPAQDTNTTYSNMAAATASAAGASGLVPAPAAGKQLSFLRGDGTWVVPTNTTYTLATISKDGLMAKYDKEKLDAFAAPSAYALKSDITNMYKYKGSVAAVANLPATGNSTGDVYNVEASGMNYAWNGTAWDALGEIFAIEKITNAQIDTIVAS